MNWKEFFKPTIGKLFLLFMLIFFSAFFNGDCFKFKITFSCDEAVGFPLAFSDTITKETGGVFDEKDLEGPLYFMREIGSSNPWLPLGYTSYEKIYYINILVDIILWYIVSIMLAYLIKKTAIKFKLVKYRNPALIIIGLAAIVIGYVGTIYRGLNFILLFSGFLLFSFGFINHLKFNLLVKIIFTIIVAILLLFFTSALLSLLGIIY